MFQSSRSRFLVCLVWTLVVLPLQVENARGQTRLQPTDISYEGAFKLDPKTGPAEFATWAYTNAPVAYFPGGDQNGSNDGYPGSLFMAGHVYNSMVAEMSIPAPVKSKDANALPTARFLQPFKDVLAGVPRAAGFIMGLAYLPPQGPQTKGCLHYCVSSDYQDVNSPAPAHGWFQTDLSAPATAGTWYVSGESVWNTGRYVAEVPLEWANANTPGLRLAVGRHRNSWGSAEGPNLFAISPWASGNPPAAGTSLSPSRTLMTFGGPGTSTQYQDFAGSDTYQGLVWLTAGGKSAVVVTGIKELNEARAYYGYENWKTPEQCEPSGTCEGQRGWRCGDGRASMLFFDPADLAAVVQRSKQPHEVVAYARLDINSFMLNPIPPTFLTTGAQAETLCASFDRARGLIYITESYALGTAPVVHVFRVRSDSTSVTLDTTPPASPLNLHVTQ